MKDIIDLDETREEEREESRGKKSHRWGVVLFEKDFTSIPNLFFDRAVPYLCVRTSFPVARTIWLVILHLARYQYESPGSRCFPAVGTLARQLGISKRRVQQIMALMEELGILKRELRDGDTTIYDLTAFSRAVLAFPIDKVGIYGG